MHLSSVGFKIQTLNTNNIYKKPLAEKDSIPKSLSNSYAQKITLQNKKPSFGTTFKPENILKLIKEENLLGMGKTNKAYSLEKLPQFVLRIPNNFKLNENKIFSCRPIKAFCKEYNFGEPIIDFGNGIQLLNKVEGVGCSFKNWVNYMKDTVLKNLPICKNAAKENLKTLQEIADFPIESYIDFANKLKFLNTTTKTVDCINPNNIIINFDSKKFNIIDLWDKGTHQTKGNAGFDHMVTLLCDGILHMDTLKVLPASKVKQYESATNLIIYKCQTAAQLVDLPNSKKEVLNSFKNVENIIKSMLNADIGYTKRYNAFCKKYNI